MNINESTSELLNNENAENMNTENVNTVNAETAPETDKENSDTPKGTGALFTLKNIIKTLSILCIAFVFCPSYLVSCSGQKVMKISAMNLVTGIKTEDFGQIVEAKPFLLICLILPLIILAVACMKNKDNKLVSGVGLGASVIDMFIWYKMRSAVKDYCTVNLCGFETTGWYTLNMIVLGAIAVISIVTIINIIGLDQDLTQSVDKKDLQKTLNQISSGAGQASGKLGKFAGEAAVVASAAAVSAAKAASSAAASAASSASSVIAEARATAANAAEEKNSKGTIIGYCAQCGTPIQRGNKFCAQCGTPVSADLLAEDENAHAEDTGAQVASAAPNTMPESEKAKASANISEEYIDKTNEKKVTAGAAVMRAIPINNKNKLAALIGAGAVIILIALFAVFGTKPTINLNKFIEVEEYGYDGYGSVGVYVNWNTMSQKYGDKLKFNKGYGKRSFGIGSSEYELSPVGEIKDKASIQIDKKSNLSNGDVIKYSWSVDKKEIEKELKCKIKFKDSTYKMSKLGKVTSFDAFEDVSVSFSGIEPNGIVDVHYSGSEFSIYDFDWNSGTGLSEGDEITVYLNSGSAENCVKENGKKPETLEKTYTVSGLDHFVADPSEIDNETMDKMINEGYSRFQKMVDDKWDKECVTLLNFDYYDRYFLSSKVKEATANNNFNIIVYKGQTKNLYENGVNRYEDLIDFYWYVVYQDMIRKADGTIEVDFDKLQTPNASFTVNTGISSGWFGTKGWKYEGYHEFDPLYEDLVLANAAEYNHFDSYAVGNGTQAIAVITETEAAEQDSEDENVTSATAMDRASVFGKYRDVLEEMYVYSNGNHNESLRFGFYDMYGDGDLYLAVADGTSNGSAVEIYHYNNETNKAEHIISISGCGRCNYSPVDGSEKYVAFSGESWGAGAFDNQYAFYDVNSHKSDYMTIHVEMASETEGYDINGAVCSADEMIKALDDKQAGYRVGYLGEYEINYENMFNASDAYKAGGNSFEAVLNAPEFYIPESVPSRTFSCMTWSKDIAAE